MPYNLTRMAKLIRHLRPTSVVDIGPGFGKWGVICREYLDIEAGRYERNEWKTRIDAVEVHEAYVTPLHYYVYDNVHIADVRTFDFEDRSYGLAIMGDVIEHMTKEEARLLLGRLPAQNLLVSTPVLECAAGGSYAGVESETHKSMWSEGDFDELEGWRMSSAARDRYMLTVLLARAK